MDLEIRLPSETPQVGVEIKFAATVSSKGVAISDAPRLASTWLRVSDVLPVGCSDAYIPTKEDIGHRLRLVTYAVDRGAKCSNHVDMLTEPVIAANPSPRFLISSPSGKSDNCGFRIVSYNLLADIYVKKGTYRYDDCCPRDALNWDYRRSNLFAEMISYDADILCLQEVQRNHFNSFFKPQFDRFGYAAVYKGKCGNSEGCATFYRSNKFKLVKNYEVEYEKMAKCLIDRLPFDQRDEAARRLIKNNIATVLILEEIGNSHSRICVANTHLLSGQNPDVRLFQASSLVRGLQKIDSLGIPILVCGDLNSPPGSDTHAFLLQAKIGNFRQETRDIIGISSFLSLNHSMNLGNAYLGALGKHQNDTLDYIFYSKDKLKVDGVLEFPPYETAGKKRQLPTPQWSSDHISLVVNIRIKKAFRKENQIVLPTDPWDESLVKTNTLRRIHPVQRPAPNVCHPLIHDYRFGPVVPDYRFCPVVPDYRFGQSVPDYRFGQVIPDYRFGPRYIGIVG